jgi:hypothetical protein
MGNYWALYWQADESSFLLSIKHHRQIPFDFEAHWGICASN